MSKLDLNSEIYVVLLAIIILLTGLTGFIIYFITLYRKKQVLYLIEREKLAVQFQQELLKTQMEIREQTMQTIGTELHDNIGQLLSLTSLTLGSVDFDDTKKGKSKIETAMALTSRSIKELRLLGRLLQGEQLIAQGLGWALQHEIDWLEKSGHYQINYLQQTDTLVEKNADKDLIIFRVFQEILNNIIKHSGATLIDIQFLYEASLICLKIADNGVGFNFNGPSEQKGMGLHNIHKRAAIIGGEVNFRSVIGEGTNIIIAIPYP